MGSTASGRPESMVFFKPDKTAALAGKDKAKHLLDELKGSLFPMHTKLFIERLGVSSDLIKAIINDDVAKVNTMSTTMAGDDFKEIMLIAAFMGANHVFNAMRTAHHFTIDDDTINIALLSGYLAQNVLRDLVHDFHVSYGSIRYAVKSDKLAVVNDLMTENAHLKFGSEHLTQAAAQNNMPIFDRIAETGVAPEGKRIHTLAQTNPELKTRLASLLENSMIAPSAIPGSAPRP